MNFARPRLRILPSIIIAVLLAPATRAHAQDGFLFKPPVMTFDLRVGRTVQGTNSEIYRELTQTLTLNNSDFHATSYGLDAAFRATPRVDVVLGAGYASSKATSESRDYIDTNDQPIIQQTTLSRVPVTAGLRLYPMSRGERIGSYAWIPRAFTPYVGAGIGMMRYRLTQVGDFVDESDLSIFTDMLESTGTAAMTYGEAGATYWLSGHAGLTGSARYTFAKAGMRDDFELFNDIDLRGFQGSAGIAVRF